MHLTKTNEQTDISIDGKEYVLTDLEQFRKLKNKFHLAGIQITESGQRKYMRWLRDKHNKPWEKEHAEDS